MKKKILSFMLIMAMILSLPQITAFAAANRTVEGKAQALKDLNLFQGEPNGEGLSSKPTQLESIVMMIRLMGKEKEALQYNDTMNSTAAVPKWAEKYVSYAYGTGLISDDGDAPLELDQVADAPTFLTLVLRALGFDDREGSFNQENVEQVSRIAGILNGDIDTENFTRGDAVSVCFAALSAPMKTGGITLGDKLIQQGVFTKEMLDRAKETAATDQQKQGKVTVHKDYKFYAPVSEGDEKVVYLTIDDGPSSNVTPLVLDTLKKYNVKATFFMLGSMIDKNPQLAKRVYEEGHTIGNHSYTHNYKSLYASPANLVGEIQKTQTSINNALGFDYGNHLFRFPGGSAGKSKALKDAVYDMGFQYVDWNCSGNDAVSPKGETVQQIVNSTIDTAGKKKDVTILIHDAAAKKTSAEALPAIIEHFKDAGYTFKTLDEAS